MEAMNEKVPQGEKPEAEKSRRPPKSWDGDAEGLDYRKVFLKSYPLMWEKADMEIERVTIMKSLQLRMKKVLVKMFLLKKMKQKIAEYQNSKYGFLTRSPSRGLLRSNSGFH